MKKTLAAVVAGTLLVAGQAFAMNEAAPRVADRIGAPVGASDEMAGVPATGLVFAALAIAAFAVVVNSDDSESD